MMPIQTIRYQQLSIAQDLDPSQLVILLGTVTGMEPQQDDLGNLQGVYRLDADGSGGYVLTFPETVAVADVDAAVASCPTSAAAASAHAAAPATAADHAAASAALISQQLASVPIPRDQIATILGTLLGEATPAIAFFEQYALDPSMTSAQWTAFQALDQTTKDRLLYDVVRSVAALIRYLTGTLPAA